MLGMILALKAILGDGEETELRLIKARAKTTKKRNTKTIFFTESLTEILCYVQQ